MGSMGLNAPRALEAPMGLSKDFVCLMAPKASLALKASMAPKTRMAVKIPMALKAHMALMAPMVVKAPMILSNEYMDLQRGFYEGV